MGLVGYEKKKKQWKKDVLKGMGRKLKGGNFYEILKNKKNDVEQLFI